MNASTDQWVSLYTCWLYPISDVVQAKDQSNSEPVGRVPSESGDIGVPGAHASQDTMTAVEEPVPRTKDYAEPNGDAANHTSPIQNVPGGAEKEARTRKTSRTSEPFDQSERDEMERLLEELRGHLGEFSTHNVICFDANCLLSTLSYPFPRRRRHRQQFLIQCRQVCLQPHRCRSLLTHVYHQASATPYI